MVKDTNILGIISQSVKKIREQNVLTQAELAKKIEVDTTTVAAWEKGKNMPSTKNVLKICDYFKIRVNDFLNLDVIPSYRRRKP